MPIDAAEKERVRFHLGYPEIQAAASIQFGIPRPMQTAFLVESAMNLIIEEAVDRVRRIIKVMDDIEMKLIESQDRLAAIQLSDLHLRDNEPDQLEHEYVRWGYRLADLIGVPVYVYSTRYRSSFTAGVSSIPVRHG
jgi:hypothetical protein